MSVFSFLKRRPSRVLRGFASLNTIIDAYKDAEGVVNASSLQAALKVFEQGNGKILDSYVASHSSSGVFLVLRRKDLRIISRHRLMVRVDRRDLAVQAIEFDEALYRTLLLARLMERQHALAGRTRKVIADMLFVILVYLLDLLDPIAQRLPEPGTGTLFDAEKTSLTEGAKLAKAELRTLKEYSDQAGLRSTVRLYLTGLPGGIFALYLVVELLDTLWPRIPTVDELRLAVVAGGIGAVTSVMFRVSQGQRLEVDSKESGAVTVLAGGFRPLIGGVFGAALYVLVMGGLIPLDVTDERLLFFAGLAFLAGFSERWAQDTILRSAPIAPSPLQHTAKGATGVTGERRADKSQSSGQ